MKLAQSGRSRTQRSSRGACARLAIATLTGTLPLLSGCPDDVQREFRDAAGDSLQSGVNAILDGFVEGFFAVLEPEEPAAEGA
jgi:hypothetical protein